MRVMPYCAKKCIFYVMFSLYVIIACELRNYVILTLLSSDILYLHIRLCYFCEKYIGLKLTLTCMTLSSCSARTPKLQNVTLNGLNALNAPRLDLAILLSKCFDHPSIVEQAKKLFFHIYIYIYIYTLHFSNLHYG